MDFEKEFFIYIFVVTATIFAVGGDDISKERCHYNIDIIQSQHVGHSPIVSSPLIADVDADGSADIITATFDGTVSVLDGMNMKPHSGSHWPHRLFNSTIHAGPMLFDIDGDGLKDIMISTTAGDIMYLKPDGTLLREKTVKIPPLLIARRWLLDGRSVDAEEVKRFVSLLHRDQVKTGDFIAFDAHILATPTLADLDGDGREEELALPVSYYDELDSPRNDYPSDLPRLDTVASAVVILNLTSAEVITVVPLHLTKLSDPNPAYLLHPLRAVDLSGQHGPMEVVVATASGLLHAVDTRGQTRPGFPVRLENGISGEVSVADLNGDGHLELLAVQVSGVVSCLGSSGNEMWSSKISGGSTAGCRLADLDDDDVLDVVIPTSDGSVWALSGKTGEPLPKWPVYLGSRLVSNVVITALSDASKALNILASSPDGNLYIISTTGKDLCVEDIDLAESLLTPVQVADIIPGTPGVEILAATMHGSVMMMSTQDEDLEAVSVSGDRWIDATSDERVAHRESKYGIFVTQDTKHTAYVGGLSFTVEFDIVDNRRVGPNDTYVIQVVAGSICLHPPQNFAEPGRYSLWVVTPTHPVRTLVEVRMADRHGLVFMDSFPVSFNTKVADEIQWLLVIPTVAMAILLLIVYGYPEVDLLPMSHSSKDR